MRAVAKGKGIKAKATRLHAEYVRSRGACERCGSVRSLQCAHIVSRRYSATRTDELNAWCLCAGCHMRLTQHPDEHVAFAWKTRGEDGYRALLDKAYAGVKANDSFWHAEVIRLESLLRSAA